MLQEKEITYIVIFGTCLLFALGAVIISFVFLYQKKKYRHQQEVLQLQENFTQEMLYSKAEIQEQTLQYVATEIHDNFSPTLSVININLASVLPEVTNPVKETITDTKVLVKQLMAEMKALSGSLNTDQINRIGFAKSLEEYINHLRKANLYDITFIITGDRFRLPPNKELILFRMCQEVLNNIVKHAEAKSIVVQLKYAITEFIVIIRDDGIGFDPIAIEYDPQKQSSTGLRNLRNRALAIAAILTIQSHNNEGTTISINLPV
jgi:signal transduction histidine kinase